MRDDEVEIPLMTCRMRNAGVSQSPRVRIVRWKESERREWRCRKKEARDVHEVVRDGSPGLVGPRVHNLTDHFAHRSVAERASAFFRPRCSPHLAL